MCSIDCRNLKHTSDGQYLAEVPGLAARSSSGVCSQQSRLLVPPQSQLLHRRQS
jgi:hypothetical protein